MSGGVLGAALRAGKIGRFAASNTVLLSTLGGITYYRDHHRLGTAAANLEAGRAELYRKYWADAAGEMGASVTDRPGGFLEIAKGDKRTLVRQNFVQLDDYVTLQLAADKPASYEFLTADGLPVADHVVVPARDLKAAEEWLASRGGRCVVKPARNAGAGAGVTCGVAEPDDLARAIAYAARWDPLVLLEHMAVGLEYRVLVLDGSVLGAVQRRPPRVNGDGQATVAELVWQENARRVAAAGTAGLWPVRLDLDAALCLKSQGLGPKSVPERGQEVVVRWSVNANGPGDNVGLGKVPPALEEMAVRAVHAMGLRLAAAEIVTADPERCLEEGVLLEVNGTPGFHYHYQVSDPSTVERVATPVLRLLLAEGRWAPLQRQN